MSKIDTSGWEEFRVGDLFTAVRGKSRKMQTLDNGNVPVIAAARSNQGIAGYYDVPVEYENHITISCNGVGCGSTFYHDYPFAITGDAIVLLEKQDMSAKVKEFITAIYDAYFNQYYSYGEKCSADKAEAECILLPSTPSGFPDWNYMENYMKKVFRESESRLENLRAADEKKKRIEAEEWKEFKISDLDFTVIHGKRMKQADREDGDIPLLTAGKENQGIGSYISNPLITCKNAITVDMFGNSFYHHGSYAGDDNIYFFTNDDISEVAKMFMASILNAENIRLYDFKHQFRQPDADTLTIPLPVTSSGEPDWKYMEEYMRNVMRKAGDKIDMLKEVRNV